MIRAILGVILGYVAMSLSLFAMFSILYMVLGTEGAFQPGSLYVSMTWLVAGFVIFFIAALVAGVVCALVSKNAKAGLWMGATIFVLGLIMAVVQIASVPESVERGTEVIGSMDAMNKALQPIGALLINPVIGFIGAFIGARLSTGSGESA